MPVQEALSFNDLPALNSSPDSVRTYFANTYGETPDGISVNSETYFNAVTPAITQTYGHPCYKTLGDFTYTQQASSPPQSLVLGTNYAINNSNESAQISITVQGEWSDTQTWSSESTTGLSFTETFKIEGIFESGTSFNVSTTSGQSSSSTSTKTISSTVTVEVPPMSKKLVSIVAQMSIETVNYTAPISVQGFFGANFPDRVQDHYFWFASADQCLNSTTGTIKGSVTNSNTFNVQTEIGASEPV
ncbi:MAG TPA: hydralysin-2 [Bacilli bacterium]|nr:hydralysin-2 [Bacilli bacterium]